MNNRIYFFQRLININKICFFNLTLLFIYCNCHCFSQTNSFATKTSENLAEYVGSYVPPLRFQLKEIEIIKKEEKLFYSLKGSNTIGELIPLKKGKFSCIDKSNWQIEFVKYNDWDVSHLNLTIGSTEYRFIKNVSPTSEGLPNLPAACKTITVTACINDESNLHIKNNMIFWETLNDVPPGTHEDCDRTTKINTKEWKDWKSPYQLNFKTGGLTVQPIILQSNEISEIIQAPDSSNGWETIMHFSDPSAYPHLYSVIFNFCPQGTIEKHVVHKITQNPNNSISIVLDTTIFKRNKSTIEIAAHKIFFEHGKAELTPLAKLELKGVYDSLKTNNKTVKIIGYKKTESKDYDDWKLYYERSISVSVYLINVGLDSKRIQFFGYGDDNKAIEKDLKKRIELVIMDR